MFNTIYLCTLYNLILRCTPDWESDHVYFLVYYATVAIFVEIHLQ